jgi:hypothetical protein
MWSSAATQIIRSLLVLSALAAVAASNLVHAR